MYASLKHLSKRTPLAPTFLPVLLQILMTEPDRVFEVDTCSSKDYCHIVDQGFSLVKVDDLIEAEKFVEWRDLFPGCIISSNLRQAILYYSKIKEKAALTKISDL